MVRKPRFNIPGIPQFVFNLENHRYSSYHYYRLSDLAIEWNLTTFCRPVMKSIPSNLVLRIGNENRTVDGLGKIL